MILSEPPGTGAPAPIARPASLPALTSLRFFLALGVVLFHYQVTMLPAGATPIALIERGRLGVDIFFILSGFVLAHVYGPQVQDGRYDHREFLVARFARIYPTHIAMLVLMALLAGVAILLRQPFASGGYTLAGWLADLTLVQAWFPITPTEWNGPAWSLSAEWAAYLAFPVFAFVGLKRGRNPWVTIGVAGVLFVVLDALYRRMYGEVLTQADFYLGVMRIPAQFLYGIGLQQLSLRLRPRRTMAIAAATASAAAVVLMMALQADERLTVAVSGLLVLSLAMVSRVGADGPLAHPWALAAGEASYAIYLAHMPLLVIWKNGVALLRGIDSSYLMTPWEAIVLLSITVAAGFALHFIWEGPARRWLRIRLSRAPISPSSLTERTT
uniref:acyltransferase family protein n=1 Tax=uncultured Caulobacter sp. TaxID=158749 RepID=UPI0025E31C05|nr:acyltransferase [uncultured Caulobacter sp.]